MKITPPSPPAAVQAPRTRAAEQAAKPFSDLLSSPAADLGATRFGALPGTNGDAATAFDARGLIEEGGDTSDTSAEQAHGSLDRAAPQSEDERASPEFATSPPAAPPLRVDPVLIEDVRPEPSASSPADVEQVRSAGVAPSISDGAEVAVNGPPGAPPPSLLRLSPADVPDAQSEEAPEGVPPPETPAAAPDGAGIALALGAREGAADVSVRVEGSGEIEPDALADGVRALLARHGLTLGSLRINGRPAGDASAQGSKG